MIEWLKNYNVWASGLPDWYIAAGVVLAVTLMVTIAAFVWWLVAMEGGAVAVIQDQIEDIREKFAETTAWEEERRLTQKPPHCPHCALKSQRQRRRP